MAYLIVIPGSAEENFSIAKHKNVWGGKKGTKYLQDLRKGDQILFVHGIKSQGQAPRGFPRLKSYAGLNINFSHILQATVKNPAHEVKNSPFGSSYPIIFDLEFSNTWENVSSNNLKGQILETIRLSVTGGRGTRSISGTEFESPFV